ncbi:AI-2E family transporter [Halocalculus aciditolerans]|uniref:AI-2E family transporter n=1 Tax=Halocalculus aciditolerans TaxID=1383812 RepID=A0A830FGY7_9EURY|nr:AI-2E family transporter [Halocalculus aciditolerans]GGL46184.1 hypothetical protein GCM10009039_00730 [Halocalculus aciditolerans]
MPSRRTVTTGVLVAVLGLAAAILADVLATVFFAVTVAALLIPVYEWFHDRGLPPWWASAATSVLAFVGTLVPLTVLAGLVYLRRDLFVDLAQAIPRELTIAVSGFTYTVDLTPFRADIVAAVANLAFDVARALPVLSLKLTLFAILIFALVMHHDDATAAFIAPVPARYHDLVRRFSDRARATLYSIYVLQAATAAATVALALPVFLLLGYPFPFTLALVAGILQFLPIVGPSLLVGALAVWKLTIGDTTGAVVLLVAAGVLVAWLPDVLVRPRLSRRTAHLPGSLYYIGFVGGLLTVGPVGIIAGPLVVALAAEAAQLLAAENTAQRTLS